MEELNPLIQLIFGIFLVVICMIFVSEIADSFWGFIQILLGVLGFVFTILYYF